MQLIIEIPLSNKVMLPLSYHHIVQSALYNGMKEIGQELSPYHDKGVNYGQRVYKLFTFGLLHGPYHVSQKRIAFDQCIKFEVRSADEKIIRMLEQSLKCEGIQIGDVYIPKVNTRLGDYHIEKKEVDIQMDSPICVYRTNRDTKFTEYFSPGDEHFEEAIQQNFRRKYCAAYGKEPSGIINLEPIEVTSKNKYVTQYKNHYITAWGGKYRICGEKEYLDFLFQTGLGSKNSQGFGMFHVI